MINRIIQHMIHNGTINAEDRDIYHYGLREGLILLANIATTLAIGLALGMFWMSILFLIVYMPLRSNAGGVHAATRWRCYVYGCLLTAAVLVAVRFIPWSPWIILPIALISSLVIYLLSPVEDANKPLDEDEIRVYRRRSHWLVGGVLLGITVCMLLDWLRIAGCMSVSLGALGVMLVLGWGKNREMHRPVHSV